MEEVLAAAKRGADLTNNMLGFSRRGDFERRPVGLDETVAQVANLLRRTVPKKVVVNDRAGPGKRCRAPSVDNTYRMSLSDCDIQWGE